MLNIPQKTTIIRNELIKLRGALSEREREVEMLKKVIVELQKSNMAILNENSMLKKSLKVAY